MKKVVALLWITTLSLSAFAQETPAGEKSFMDDPLSHPMMPLYALSAFVFVVVILVAFVAFYMIKILSMLTVQAEKENAEKLGTVYKPRLGLWSKFSQAMNASVPLEQEKSIELDHNYD